MGRRKDLFRELDRCSRNREKDARKRHNRWVISSRKSLWRHISNVPIAQFCRLTARWKRAATGFRRAVGSKFP